MAKYSATIIAIALCASLNLSSRSTCLATPVDLKIQIELKGIGDKDESGRNQPPTVLVKNLEDPGQNLTTPLPPVPPSLGPYNPIAYSTFVAAPKCPKGEDFFYGECRPTGQ